MSLLNHYRISLASSESLTPSLRLESKPSKLSPRGNSMNTMILKIGAYTPIFEIVEYSSISQKQVVHVAT